MCIYLPFLLSSDDQVIQLLDLLLGLHDILIAVLDLLYLLV
jgi:hypothetical protein